MLKLKSHHSSGEVVDNTPLSVASTTAHQHKGQTSVRGLSLHVGVHEGFFVHVIK